MDAVCAALGDVGLVYLALPLFPVFEMVHYAKVALVARSDPGSKEFAVKYPLSSCLSTILLGCGGGIFTNLVLGRPLGEIFLNPYRLALASLVWYLVFFFPGDIVYRILTTTPLKAIIVVMKDIRRLRQVLIGIELAFALHPNAYLLAIVAGTTRATGTNLMVTVDRFLRGDNNVHNHELLKPKYPTKFSFLAACLLVAQQMDVLLISRELLITILAAVLIFGSLSTLLFGCRDPFSAVGSFLCPILFGTAPDQAPDDGPEGQKPKEKDD